MRTKKVVAIEKGGVRGRASFKGRARSQADKLADLAQLGERMTEDHKVPGSIPGVGILFILSPSPVSYSMKAASTLLLR